MSVLAAMHDLRNQSPNRARVDAWSQQQVGGSFGPRSAAAARLPWSRRHVPGTDVMMCAIMAGLALQGAAIVVRQDMSELRQPAMMSAE
jgi:hypothetical protein